MADLDMTAPPTLRVAAPKPKMTIYYALLIIALIAMLTACLFMFLEIPRFPPELVARAHLSAGRGTGGSSSKESVSGSAAGWAARTAVA